MKRSFSSGVLHLLSLSTLCAALHAEPILAPQSTSATPSTSATAIGQFPQDYIEQAAAAFEYWSIRALFPLTDLSQAASKPEFAALHLKFVRLNISNSVNSGSTSSESSWNFNDVYRFSATWQHTVFDSYLSTNSFSRDALGLAGVKRTDEGAIVWVHGNSLKIHRAGTQTSKPGSCGLNLSAELTVEEVPISATFSTHYCPVMEADGAERDIPGENGFTQLFEARLLTSAQETNLNGVAWLERGWGHLPNNSAPVVVEQYLIPIPSAIASRLTGHANFGTPGDRRVSDHSPAVAEAWLRVISLRRTASSQALVLSASVHGGTQSTQLDYRDLALDAKVVESSSSLSFVKSWELLFRSTRISLTLDSGRTAVENKVDDTGRWSGVVEVISKETLGGGETAVATEGQTGQASDIWFGFVDAAAMLR